MKKIILAFVFMLFVSGGCSTTDMAKIYGYTPPTVKGVTKPTIFTAPPRYLDSFPLGTVTEEDLINNLGIPGDSYKLNGKTYLSYEIAKSGRKFVYVLSNGVVTDVVYHDQGPYNGASAKKRQNK